MDPVHTGLVDRGKGTGAVGVASERLLFRYGRRGGRACRSRPNGVGRRSRWLPMTLGCADIPPAFLLFQPPSNLPSIHADAF